MPAALLIAGPDAVNPLQSETASLIVAGAVSGSAVGLQSVKASHAFDSWGAGLQAPQFATDARARKTQHKSHEELEAEEMAAMPHFRAKALK